MKRSKKSKPAVGGAHSSSSAEPAQSHPIPREIQEAQIREGLEEMSRRHLEETGEQLCWGQVLNVERMLCDPEHRARNTLKDLEAALARPAIGFADREILQRCDGIINAGWERFLTKGQRRELLEGRKKLASRIQRLQRREEKRACMAIAEELFRIVRAEVEILRNSECSETAEPEEKLAPLRRARSEAYEIFQPLLDTLSEPIFCRCVEYVWDYWVHGGPAEFLQDVNVYHMAKMYPLLKAEAERQRMPQVLPDQKKWAAAMRRGYPGESHLSEGFMNKSYGFVIPLPLLPRHIARYVTSDRRNRKQWYVPWMQWYLSYGATVDPKTEEWRQALEASYEPFVRRLIKKACGRVSKQLPASEKRELLVEIENRLRSELRRAIDDFDFFFKKVTYIGATKFELPPPPRPASVLTSTEIPFVAYIEDRLRGVLRTLIVGEWQVGEAWYTETIYVDGEAFMSERLTSAALGVTRQTLFKWRRAGRMWGVRWGVLSRSGKSVEFRGESQQTPPSSWIFYSEGEIRRIHEMRKKPVQQPGAESGSPITDISSQVAETFAEAQDLPAASGGKKKPRDDRAGG